MTRAFSKYMRLSLSRLSPLHALSVLALAVLPACSPVAEEVGEGESAETDGKPALLCAAVRGNGEGIFAHFGSLAAITEDYGIVRGMAGGSSGSITTFIYESMLMSDAITHCGSGADRHRCSDKELQPRLALALKSVEGYTEAVAESDEVEDIKSLTKRIKKLQDETAGFFARAGAGAGAAKDLKDILERPEFRHMVNPAALGQLKPDLPANVLNMTVADVRHAIDQVTFGFGEAKKAALTMTAFQVDQNRLFFREGLLNWDMLATLFGRVGDFYAGGEYGPAGGEARDAALGSWLDKCSEPMANKLWSEAIASNGPSVIKSCTADFVTLAKDYRAAVVVANQDNPKPEKPRYKSRVDAQVSNDTLHKLVTTAVLEGAAATSYASARAEYLSGKYPAGTRIASFQPSFDDIKFGYWGSAADLEKINTTKFSGDLKTKKRTIISSKATWRDVFHASPAEPGLSRFTEITAAGARDAQSRFSAGGWSDLAPVLVLKDMGCDKVIYVQRQGAESQFAVEIAKQLGMSNEQAEQLYDLKKDSSFKRSLDNADATWCTNWNAFNAFAGQITDLVVDAYSKAEVVTNDPWFKNCGASGGQCKSPASSAPLGCAVAPPTTR